ncbi:ATP-binding cassette subfamily B protein [Anaerobacterium chartisolvens]|uniref:ATP-binding cassette subfamily B protein n=1 Tax=Anaerobacterium chartisolvens TaxID=1297424 RepID=A0A369B1B5_9FIRM|nr:ABC transporter ATP-binding protein [Anaerobacterium chartisolvens]RCX15470.1 ATP-binding cassette subfamily B protein [Anaerobacterium chartisolvens]
MKFNNEDKKVIKRILYLFKPYIKKVTLILVCMLISAGISMMIPRISQQLMDRGLLAHNYKLLIIFTLAGLALLLIEQGLGFIETKNRIYLNSIIPYTLSKNAFKHTLRMKMQSLNDTNTAEIMSTIGMDVGNIGRICDSSTFYILSSIFKMVGGFIGLLLIDWRLTLMVVVIVPFRYILVKYIAKKRKQLFEEYLKLNKDFAAFYGDTVSGVKEIKLWGLDRIKIGKFIKGQRELININIKMGLIDKLNEFSETVLFQVIMDVIYIMGAYLVFQNSLTIGELFAFITYSSYVTGPISAILNIGYNFVNIIPSAKRYFDYMDREGEPYGRNRGTESFAGKDSEVVITYEDVSFSYTNEKQILDKVSFEIREGEKVAIVGANGSGKSTIINLLLRFYQPTSGKILLNGIDINSIDLREYRSMISVVSQDMYLFNASIKENITLNTKTNELNIHKAVKECGIDKFIEKLPEKYETVVGKNGTGVSGGEKQKIALARAIIRASKILVLDEATANYDMESEAAVNKFIGKELSRKTAIIISHKPDILKYVSKVIVLENGSIVDIGKHNDLCMRNEQYKKMMEAHETFKDNQAI